MAASAYHVISNEVEYRFFRHNRIFRHACMYKETKMTKQWNYCTFMQILYSYLRYTDRLLGVFSLLLALILSELHENSRRKVELQKKSTSKICASDITFLAPCPPSFVIFVAFSGASDNTPFPPNPLYLNLSYKEVY